MDNILGNHISGRCLGAKDKGHGPCRLLAGFDLQIFMNDIKGIHLLALILMQPLTLDIKDGIRIQGDTFHLFHVSRQIPLPVHLDLGDTVKHFIVIHIGKQFFQLIGVFLITVPDGLRKEPCQLPVAG